jgi:spermidine synthase
MIPWQLLDSAQVPGEDEVLCLYRRGGEFSIRVDGSELMGSRLHGSEEALAELACARLASRPCPQVLIGGLGMGFTLAAALNRLGTEGRVVVAELVPTVVAWNRGPLAALAGRPLEDDRVTVREVDVAQILRTERRQFDAILLDVDNGPRGLTRKGNDWLYTRAGLAAAFAALRPAGILALWSANPNRAFAQLLRKAGFAVDEEHVRARGSRGGGYHTIWIAGRVARSGHERPPVTQHPGPE